MKTNNVILVSPYPPPYGGIASWTVSYMNYFEKNRFLNVRLINSAVIGRRVNDQEHKNLMDEIIRVVKLRRQVKREITNNHDIIHYNSSCSITGLMKDLFVLRRINNKIVYQCHCDLTYQVNSEVKKLLFSRVLKRVNQVIVLNNKSLEFALNYHRSVKYIPNFIDSIYVSYDDIDYSDKIHKICYVGRMVADKGINEIISVARKLPEIQFYLIGPGYEGFTDSCSDLNNVTFMGSMDKANVINQLKKMDLFLFPSYSEGFPVCILEAMSCGLPIVATDVGSISDMLESTGGKIVSVGKVDEMVRAIESLNDKDKRILCSKSNLMKIKSEYLIDVVMRKFIELYQQRDL